MAAVWEAPEEPGCIVGAISLKRDTTLDLGELEQSLSALGRSLRPARLAILDSLPVTGGFRPLKPLIRTAPDEAPSRIVCDRGAGHYHWVGEEQTS